RIARSGCRSRGACHMLLSGRGTTRIKRGHRIWPNHTPRSMSIQWDTVLFGRMGSPNIYKLLVNEWVKNDNLDTWMISCKLLRSLALPFVYLGTVKLRLWAFGDERGVGLGGHCTTATSHPDSRARAGLDRVSCGCRKRRGGMVA